MPGIAGIAVRVVLAGISAAGLVVTGPAIADLTGGERVTRYDVGVAVRADGTAHVRETITYDFGRDGKHGIERDIRYDSDAGDGRARRTDISGIKVTSPDAPAQTEVTDDGTYDKVRVGDPARTVTGTRTYVIDYDTDHVATTVGGAVRYAWNAVGTEWDVPISGITVELTGPAATSGQRCFAGPFGSGASCDGARVSGGAARFTQGHVEAREGVTVQTDFPAGSVTAAPEYHGLSSGDTDFGSTGVSDLPDIGTRIAIGVLLALAIGLYGYGWYRRSRLARRPIPPGLPDDLTPGLAAKLLELSGETKDDDARIIQGTLLDLARRGFLRIDDIPGKLYDWTLTRTEADAPAPAVYEQALLDGLFAGREQVTTGKLRYAFRGTVRTVLAKLREEAGRRGWSPRDPTVQRAVVYCVAVCWILGIGQLFVHVLDGWPYLVPALILLAVVGWSDFGRHLRLTPRGYDACGQVKALRERLERRVDLNEIDAQWALPYVVAFGQVTGVSRLTRGDASRFGFYSGTALASFALTAGDDLVAREPTTSGSSGYSHGGYSGGGGFSGGSVGGGGGGGGGGSW